VHRLPSQGPSPRTHPVRLETNVAAAAVNPCASVLLSGNGPVWAGDEVPGDVDPDGDALDSAEGELVGRSPSVSDPVQEARMARTMTPNERTFTYRLYSPMSPRSAPSAP
jgi:hypothetical protein